MQNDQEWNALVPGNARAGGGLRHRTTDHGGLGLPRRHARSSYFFTNHFDAAGQPTAVRHPERPGGPARSVARRQADLGDSGPAPAPAELRPAHPRRRGVLRQLHPGQPLVLHRHPHRRAGQPALPRRWWSRRRAAPRSASPRTDSGTSCPTTPTARVRPRSCRACWAARSSSPIGCAPTSASGSSTTTTCRARRTPSTVRPGRRSGHDRSTTMTFGNNSFRHFNRNITDWSASLGLNYRLNDNLSLYAAGSARLQDARAGRVPERARPGAGGPVRARGGAVGRGRGQVRQLGRVAFTVNGFYTKLKNIIGQGGDRAGDRRHRLGHP